MRLVISLKPGLLSRLADCGRRSLGPAAPGEWLLPVIAAFGFLFVAEEGEDIIASAQVFACRESGDLYMDAFYVVPERRRRGLGRELLGQVMDRLGREGYSRLLVTADPGNEAAMALYRATGFEELEELGEFYGAGRRRLLLAAPLRRGGGA